MEKTIQIRAAGIEDAWLIKEMARKTFMETYGEMNTPENMEAYLQSQFSDERMEEMRSLADLTAAIQKELARLQWIDSFE